MAEAGAGQNPDPNPDPKPAPHCAWVPRDDEEFEVSDEEECLLVFIQLCSEPILNVLANKQEGRNRRHMRWYFLLKL